MSPRLKVGPISFYLHLRDGFNTFKDIRMRVRERGLDGVAITDHNTIKGAKKFATYESDMIILVGEEIKTLAGDIIALGIEEEIKPHLPPEETLDIIKELNGITILPHPLAKKGVGSYLKNFSKKIDAIETLNSMIPKVLNQKANSLANEFKIPKTGGSDAHIPESIGDAVTEIDCSNEPILEAIKKGRTNVYGVNHSLLGITRRKLKHWKLKYF